MAGVLSDVYDVALLGGYCLVAGWRRVFGGKPISGLAEKIAPRPRTGSDAETPCIWLHGVSMGEIRGTRSLVTALTAARPDVPIVISSTTATGYAEAKRLYPDLDVRYWPLDTGPICEAAIRRIRPAVVVLMELEMWPTFSQAARRAGVPIVVVNGRITDRAYRRYRRFHYVFAQMFNCAVKLAMQTDRYASRLLHLGVDPSRITVNGTMKYDTIRVGGPVAGAKALARSLGLKDDDQMLVAGSTADGEEVICIEAYRQLRSEHPRLKLVIVPRHPERFDEVAELIRKRGFLLTRRSEHPDDGKPAARRDAIILGDTMGELTKFYWLSTVAFVGRSLVPLGGSDMIEVAALGRPAVFGPHTSNFADPVRQLLAGEAAIQVRDTQTLREAVGTLLSEPKIRKEIGRRAMKLVRDNQGATQRNVELILSTIAEG